MTIEELMKKYNKKTPAVKIDEKMEVDSDDDECKLIFFFKLNLVIFQNIEYMLA